MFLYYNYNMDMPDLLGKYFWDIDINKLDKGKHSGFIIERILEFGDIEVLRWLFKIYPLNDIKDTLKKSRILSRKSANLWSIFLDVDRGEIKCMKRFYQKKQEKIWNY